MPKTQKEYEYKVFHQPSTQERQNLSRGIARLKNTESVANLKSEAAVMGNRTGEMALRSSPAGSGSGSGSGSGQGSLTGFSPINATPGRTSTSEKDRDRDRERERDRDQDDLSISTSSGKSILSSRAKTGGGVGRLLAGAYNGLATGLGNGNGSGSGSKLTKSAGTNEVDPTSTPDNPREPERERVTERDKQRQRERERHREAEREFRHGSSGSQSGAGADADAGVGTPGRTGRSDDPLSRRDGLGSGSGPSSASLAPRHLHDHETRTRPASGTYARMDDGLKGYTVKSPGELGHSVEKDEDRESWYGSVRGGGMTRPGVVIGRTEARDEMFTPPGQRRGGYDNGDPYRKGSGSSYSTGNGNGNQRLPRQLDSPDSYRTRSFIPDESTPRDRDGRRIRSHASQQSFAFPTSRSGSIQTDASGPTTFFPIGTTDTNAVPAQETMNEPKPLLYLPRMTSDRSVAQIGLPAPPRRSSLPIREDVRPLRGATDGTDSSASSGMSGRMDARPASYKGGDRRDGGVEGEKTISRHRPSRSVHHKASGTFRPTRKEPSPDGGYTRRPILTLGKPIGTTPFAPATIVHEDVETPRPGSVSQGSIHSSDALSAESGVAEDRRPSMASVTSNLDSGIASIMPVDGKISSMPANLLPRRTSSRRRLQSYNLTKSGNADNTTGDVTDGGETSIVVQAGPQIVESRPDPNATSPGEETELSTSPQMKRPSSGRTRSGTASSRAMTAAEDAAAQERRARRGRLKREYSHVKDDQPRAPASAMYYSPLAYYGSPPTQRLRSHTGTLVGHKIYYHGGCDSSGCWTGMAIFNTEAQSWSQVKAEGVALPHLRAHTTTLVGKRLYVIGGGDGGTYNSVVWCYDTEENEWYKPYMRTPAGECPLPRRAHTTVHYKNHLVCFGGGNGSTGLNDVWALDVSDPWGLTWTEWKTTGDVPMEMGYHTANLVRGKMIVYGGSDGVGSFPHVYVLDMKTHVWTLVDTKRNIGRLSHTATQIGSYLFVLGGHDGGKYEEDVWLLNLVTFRWETKAVHGKVPGGRGYHEATFHDGRLIVHGGFNGRTHFGDMHVLELAGNAYLSQVSAFDIDERSHRFVEEDKHQER